MSFDIYGNRLARGHCEVHPHVHQEYPCDLCMNERQRQTVRASYPKCGICGKFESCADSCGVPVCSEGCAHEAERRSGEADGLRAALTAERERADRAEADLSALRAEFDKAQMMFYEFVQDWKKGDFSLSTLAALDVQAVMDVYERIETAQAAREGRG